MSNKKLWPQFEPEQIETPFDKEVKEISILLISLKEYIEEHFKEYDLHLFIYKDEDQENKKCKWSIHYYRNFTLNLFEIYLSENSKLIISFYFLDHFNKFVINFQNVNGDDDNSLYKIIYNYLNSDEYRNLISKNLGINFKFKI